MTLIHLHLALWDSNEVVPFPTFISWYAILFLKVKTKIRVVCGGVIFCSDMSPGTLKKKSLAPPPIIRTKGSFCSYKNMQSQWLLEEFDTQTYKSPLTTQMLGRREHLKGSPSFRQWSDMRAWSLPLWTAKADTAQVQPHQSRPHLHTLGNITTSPLTHL